MITKKLLESVEAFDRVTETGHYRAYDVFTLRFRQWWKRDMKLKIERDIVKYDYENDRFTHRISARGVDFLNLLEDQVLSTYTDAEELTTPEVTNLGNNVFKVNFKKEEEKE